MMCEDRQRELGERGKKKLKGRAEEDKGRR